MKRLYLISGIILIVLSAILLLITPLALLGVLLGIFSIWYSNHIIKPIEITKPEKITPEQIEDAPFKETSRPQVDEVRFSYVNKDILNKYKVGEEELSADLKYYYDRGEKIYKNIYSFEEAKIELQGNDVIVDGEKFGTVKDVQTHPNSWFSIEAFYGPYAKIVRNEDYDPEEDGEDEKNWTEYDCLEKPKATLFIHWRNEL